MAKQIVSFSDQRVARSKMLTLRVTPEQDALLTIISRQLLIMDKAEIVRQALDYWIATGPQASAIRRLSPVP